MDHNSQEVKWSCALNPMRRDYLAYITCSLALVVASCGDNSRSTAHASSTDVAPMINAQIQALPPQGGTVDLRSLTGMQFVDSQIVVDHPVNLLLQHSEPPSKEASSTAMPIQPAACTFKISSAYTFAI